jgi:hypothetical protein
MMERAAASAISTPPSVVAFGEERRQVVAGARDAAIGRNLAQTRVDLRWCYRVHDRPAGNESHAIRPLNAATAPQMRVSARNVAT